MFFVINEGHILSKRQPIDNPDTSNLSKSYWEKVLRSHGLSSRKGENTKEKFVGGINDLVDEEQEQYRRDTGIKHPVNSEED